MSAAPPPSVRGRCHYFGLGQFHLGVFAHFNIGGNSYGCQLFSEPTLAVADEDLYLRSADGARGETLISGPLLGALRTVREVERLADAVENLPDDKPALAPLDGTLAFWDLQRGQYPRYVLPTYSSQNVCSRPGPPADCFHRPTSGGRGRLHRTAPNHRGGRRRAPHALRPG